MLENDRHNLYEFGSAALAAARLHYTALLREGYNPICARCMAIAYLMRKTRWTWPLASGAFDNSPAAMSAGAFDQHQENDK